MAKKKMNKYIATAAAVSVVVAPMAVTPADAANTTATTVTNAINALQSTAAVSTTFYNAVSAARTDYNNLVAAQKNLVTAATVTKLVNAENAVLAMQKIAALDPDASDVTTKIAEIRAIYSKLPAAGKMMVKNYSTLADIEAEVAIVQANATAAGKVTNQIRTLGLKPTADAVTAARTAFDNLTNPQKALVTIDTLAVLSAAEDYIDSITAAVNKVGNYATKVAAIVSATTVSSRSDAIAAAQLAYLTDAEIALLPSDKNTDLANAKKTYDNYAVAHAVVNQIAALSLAGDFAAYTTAVKNARAAYAALPAAQKVLVTNLATLQGHEARVAQGETPVNPDAVAAQAVEALINALPAVGAATIADLDKVTNANTKYNELSPEAKLLVDGNLVTKLNSLTSLAIFTNAADIAAFEADVAALKTRGSSTIDAAILALDAKYALLSAGVKAEIDRLGNYDDVKAAKPVVLAIKEAVVGVPAGQELTVADAKVTALLTAEQGYAGLDENEKLYVRNISLLTTKIAETKAAIKQNAKTAITAIPTVNSTSATVLESRINAAEAAVAKFANILDVADFVDAAESEKSAIDYAKLVDAKAALPAVQAVAGLTYIHPVTGAVNVGDLTTAIDKYKLALPIVTPVINNPYFVNKSKFEGIDKTAIERSLAALATAADAEITKLKTVSPKNEDSLDVQIDIAEAAVTAYDNANTLYTGASNNAAITKLADIQLANDALPVVALIDAITDFNDTPATAITRNKAARTAYDALNDNIKPFVINYSKLTDNEAKVNGNLAGLKATANVAISNMTSATTKEQLATKAGDASTAVSTYVAAYKAVYTSATDADAQATLLNYDDIATALAANDLLTKVDALPLTLSTNEAALDAEIEKYLEVKELVDALPAGYKFFVNKTKYNDFVALVEGKLGALKGDAEAAIDALSASTVDDKAKLTTAVGDADTAVNAYTKFYADIEKGTVAEAKTTLSKIADVEAARTALNGIVTDVDGAATYTHTDPVVAATLNTAIDNYNDLKALVTALSSEKFFVNKAKYLALKTNIDTSLALLKTNAETKIGALSGITAGGGKTVAKLLQEAVTAARAEAAIFINSDKKLNGTTDAQSGAKLTNYAYINQAADAQPVLLKIEDLSYAHPTDDAVVVADLLAEILKLEASKHSVNPEMVANPFFVEYGKGDYADVIAEVEESIEVLETKAETAIANLLPATTSVQLGTNISTANTAVSEYLEAYVMYNTVPGKTEAQIRQDGMNEIADYEKIAFAEKAKLVVEQVEGLTYVHPTTGSVVMSTLTSAITAFHNAKTAADGLTDDEEAFFINKSALDKTALTGAAHEIVLSVGKLADDAKAAINKLNSAEVTDAATLNNFIAAAEAAVLDFETADKALSESTTADLTKIDNLANIAAAKAAVSVAITIEVAFGAIDNPATITEHERLVALTNAKSAFDALANNTIKGFVFNAGDLATAISTLDAAFTVRKNLLAAANDAVAALKGIDDADDLTGLINDAELAISNYVANEIADTAAPLATDVVDQADIALYKAAKATIEKIDGIQGASDKEAEVLAAKALYNALTQPVKDKVFNYSELTAAAAQIAGDKAQTNSDAKELAEDEIAALKTLIATADVTVEDFEDQIEAADEAVTAYTELATTNSILDIENIDELDYAKEAVSTIKAINALTANSSIEDIQAVKDQYAGLLADVKTYVFNASKVIDLESGKNNSAQNAVKNLVTALATTPAANLVAAAQTALDAYNALTPEQKAALADQKIIEKINNYIAAAPVIVKVTDLTTEKASWTASLTDAQIAAIDARIATVRSDYSKLIAAQKMLVTNYTDLMTSIDAAIQKVKSDKSKSADQLIADAVINKIAALDDMDDTTAAYVAAVQDARASYRALLVKHKVLVTNLADLVRHEQNVLNK